MSLRTERLSRLLAIRRLQADLDRRDLQQSLASVAEVEAGLARQETAMAAGRASALMALSAGDRGEWLMSDAQSEVAGWNMGRLDAMLKQRSGAVASAMERFRESRREHEQAKQLVADARQAAMSEEDRKAQAAADDWFLSKRAHPAE